MVSREHLATHATAGRGAVVTADNPTYPECVELTDRMLCLDGEYRNDCVVVLDPRHDSTGEPVRCGKPIKGIVHSGNILGDVRMCEECLDGAVVWMVPPDAPTNPYSAALLGRLAHKTQASRE